MTMTFKTDTILNAIANGNISSTSLSATATTIQPPLQMSSHDLNLEEIWRRAATTTVRLLHKRNANSDIHRQTTTDGGAGGDDNDYHVGNDSDLITNELLNKNEHETTVTTTATATEVLANNLTATITSIRSNVTKVLYMYFHPNQTVADDHMNMDDMRLSNTSSQHATHIHDAYESDEPFGNLSHQLPKGNDEENPLTKVKSTLATKIATAMASEIFQTNTTYNNSVNGTTTAATTIHTTTESNNDNNNNNSNVLLTTLTHLKKFLNTTATTNNSLIATTTSTTTPAVVTTATSATTIARNITYPSINIHSYENCSALFANYTQPHNQKGE